MKRVLCLTLSLMLVALVFSSVLARPNGSHNYNIEAVQLEAPVQTAPDFGTRADTTFLFATSGPGSWGTLGTDDRGFIFNNNEAAGWTSEDASAQIQNFWNVKTVDINIGYPTEPIITVVQFDGQPNNFALWCGADDQCGWVDNLGYGTNWKQWAVLETVPANPGGSWNTSLDLDFWYISDFEGDTYDFFEVLLEVGDDLVSVYHNAIGSDTTLRHITVNEAAAAYEDDVRDVYFYFTSDGGWSDEDGSYLSNVGAVWIDAVTLTVDGSTVFQSDFESGTQPSGLTFTSPPGAGDYANLYANLYNEDECVYNTSHAWAFFDIGTTNPEYPIGVIVYGGPWTYLDNMIVSPILDKKHQLGVSAGEDFLLDEETKVLFTYWIYLDLPQNAEVYYRFDVGAFSEDLPCIAFANNNTVYYGGEGVWVKDNLQDVTQQVLEAAFGEDITGLVVKVGAIDMCGVWCGTPGHGDGTGHTPAPYIDNVRVMLINESAIAWNIDIFNRFQDNFANVSNDGAGGIAGKVRVDNAHNIEDTTSPTVIRGDSCIIELNMDLSGGIVESFCTEASENRPNLWMYFRVTDGPHAGMLNASMGDQSGTDGIHSPMESSQNMFLTQGGETHEWGAIRCDLGYVNGNPQANKFAWDFNDGYFEPGDRIIFFYRAESGYGDNVTQPQYATAANEDLRGYYVWRALPTEGRQMLFVDDARGAWPRWREAFRYNGFLEYDEYFTQAASSGLENGIGGMGYFEAIAGYWYMIWDSGGLGQYTICSAENDDKTDDAALINTWLNTNTHNTYFWVMGDQVAVDMATTSFLSNTLGATLMSDDSYSDVNGISSPLVYATHPDLEYLGGEPTYWVEGGCPYPNDFAVVSTDATNSLSIMTHEFEVPIIIGANTSGAGILNQDPDGDGTDTVGGHTNRTLLMPYAYWNVRDTGYAVSASRIYMRLMVGHILEGLFGALPDGDFNAVPEGVPAVTKLDGNFPNPFNPKTTINYSLATPEHVNLSVYDISGRLVSTLVNGKQVANNYSQTWNGTDNNGQRVSSGVYFYKLNAGDYSATDKMVLVK